MIKEKLDPDEIFPDGLDYLYFESIDSTNKYAKENSNTISNAVIVAENQYSGVGKNSTSWWSSPYRSILTTLVLSVDMEPDKISMFPLFIGAMIHEVLEANGISSSIKWPNDIYLAGRKLAGILCESVIKDGRVEKLIIGFGININQTPEELIEGNMTSLYNYTGREF
ncbi:MAG: biotin--[acetyl-CoA-carboxylase] ligase, partial [Clostridiales bacterium]|nr:biotin--[acetyl-CoA-carboxylase] ligase [Clostridiales bacterium]